MSMRAVFDSGPARWGDRDLYRPWSRGTRRPARCDECRRRRRAEHYDHLRHFARLALKSAPAIRFRSRACFDLSVFKNKPSRQATAMKPALRAGLNTYLALGVRGAVRFQRDRSIGRPSASSSPGVQCGSLELARGPLDRPRFSFGPPVKPAPPAAPCACSFQIGLGNIFQCWAIQSRCNPCRC